MNKCKIYKLIKQAYFESVYNDTVSGFRLVRADWTPGEIVIHFVPISFQICNGNSFMFFYDDGKTRIESYYPSVYHVFKLISNLNFFDCFVDGCNFQFDRSYAPRNLYNIQTDY